MDIEDARKLVRLAHQGAERIEGEAVGDDEWCEAAMLRRLAIEVPGVVAERDRLRLEVEELKAVVAAEYRRQQSERNVLD